MSNKLTLPIPAAQAEPSPPSYHVRSHQTIAEIQSGERRAQRQEDLILAWLADMPGRRVTPSEAWAAFKHYWPLTSVRRALTNLTNAGKLRHWPADRRMGPYGVNESTWSLAEHP